MWFVAGILLSTFCHGEDGPEIRCDGANSAKPSYELIRTLIVKCNIKDIDKLLPLLPRELQVNSTLSFKSRSPERDSVDWTHPRIILFSKDAKLILAYTTDPQKPHYNRLQAMQFRDDNAKFDLYDLEFLKNGSVTENDQPLSQEKERKPHQNPQSCLKCHGSDPHPIWEAYEEWPGFYGTFDDNFSKSEKDHWKEMVTTQADSPRIKWLELSPAIEEYYVNRPGKYSNLKLGGTENNLEKRPNHRLTTGISLLNAQRIVRRMKESPQYERYKYKIFSLLSGCEKHNPSPKQLSTLTTRLAIQAKEKRARDMALLGTGGDGSIFEQNEIGQLARLEAIAALLGQSVTADYSFGLEKDGYVFFDGTYINSFSDQLGVRVLYQDLLKTDPMLRTFLEAGISSHSESNKVNLRDYFESNDSETAVLGNYRFCINLGNGSEGDRFCDGPSANYKNDHHFLNPFQKACGYLREKNKKGNRAHSKLYRDVQELENDYGPLRDIRRS